MHYSPKFVSFNEADTFDHVVINLVDAGGVSLAGADISTPPIVDGKYQIELAVHGLTPASYPALADVELRAKIRVKSGATVSNPGFSSPFVFTQSFEDPTNITVEG